MPSSWDRPKYSVFKSWKRPYFTSLVVLVGRQRNFQSFYRLVHCKIMRVNTWRDWKKSLKARLVLWNDCTSTFCWLDFSNSRLEGSRDSRKNDRESSFSCTWCIITWGKWNPKRLLSLIDKNKRCKALHKLPF